MKFISASGPLGPLQLFATIAVMGGALADYGAQIGPLYPWGVPLFTSILALAVMLLALWNPVVRGSPQFDRRVLAALLVLGACAIGYAALSYAFTGVREYADGRTERVVLGYSLQPQLEQAIQATIQKQANSSDITPRKSEEEIRQEAIERVTTVTGNPAAPYAKRSRGVIAVALLALWEFAFAGLGTLIATLVPPAKSSRSREGRRNPKHRLQSP